MISSINKKRSEAHITGKKINNEQLCIDINEQVQSNNQNFPVKIATAEKIKTGKSSRNLSSMIGNKHNYSVQSLKGNSINKSQQSQYMQSIKNQKQQEQFSKTKNQNQDQDYKSFKESQINQEKEEQGKRQQNKQYQQLQQKMEQFSQQSDQLNNSQEFEEQINQRYYRPASGPKINQKQTKKQKSREKKSGNKYFHSQSNSIIKKQLLSSFQSPNLRYDNSTKNNQDLNQEKQMWKTQKNSPSKSKSKIKRKPQMSSDFQKFKKFQEISTKSYQQSKKNLHTKSKSTKFSKNAFSVTTDMNFKLNQTESIQFQSQQQQEQKQLQSQQYQNQNQNLKHVTNNTQENNQNLNKKNKKNKTKHSKKISQISSVLPSKQISEIKQIKSPDNLQDFKPKKRVKSSDGLFFHNKNNKKEQQMKNQQFQSHLKQLSKSKSPSHEKISIFEKQQTQHIHKANHHHLSQSQEEREKIQMHVELMIQQNLRQQKIEKMNKEMEKLKEEEEKQQKQEYLQTVNENIRRQNQIKYLKQQMQNLENEGFEQNKKIPWGANQQRLKDYTFSVIQKNFDSQQKREHYNLTDNENLKKQQEMQRRDRLGLGVLNEFDEEFIEQIVQKNKQKLLQKNEQIQNNDPLYELEQRQKEKEKKKLSEEEMQKVKQFMEKKKKFLEMQESLKAKEEEDRKKKKNQQLNKLQSEVKQIFQRCAKKNSHSQKNLKNKQNPPFILDVTPINKDNSFENDNLFKSQYQSKNKQLSSSQSKKKLSSQSKKQKSQIQQIIAQQDGQMTIINNFMNSNGITDLKKNNSDIFRNEIGIKKQILSQHQTPQKRKKKNKISTMSVQLGQNSNTQSVQQFLNQGIKLESQPKIKQQSQNLQINQIVKKINKNQKKEKQLFSQLNKKDQELIQNELQYNKQRNLSEIELDYSQLYDEYRGVIDFQKQQDLNQLQNNDIQIGGYNYTNNIFKKKKENQLSKNKKSLKSSKNISLHSNKAVSENKKIQSQKQKQNEKQDQLKNQYNNLLSQFNQLVNSNNNSNNLSNFQQNQQSLDSPQQNGFPKVTEQQTAEQDSENQLDKFQQNNINQIVNEFQEQNQNEQIDIQNFIQNQKQNEQSNHQQQYSDVQFLNNNNHNQNEEQTSQIHEDYEIDEETYNYIQQEIQKQNKEKQNINVQNSTQQQQNQQLHQQIENENFEFLQHQQKKQQQQLQQQQLQEQIELQQNFEQQQQLQQNLQYSLNQLSGEEQNISQEEQFYDEEELERIAEEIFRNAALQIQKMWRGFYTRKVLKDYLNYLNQQEEYSENGNEQEEEYINNGSDQDNIQITDKSEQQQQKQYFQQQQKNREQYEQQSQNMSKQQESLEQDQSLNQNFYQQSVQDGSASQIPPDQFPQRNGTLNSDLKLQQQTQQNSNQSQEFEKSKINDEKQKKENFYSDIDSQNNVLSENIEKQDFPQFQQKQIQQDTNQLKNQSEKDFENVDFAGFSKQNQENSIEKQVHVSQIKSDNYSQKATSNKEKSIYSNEDDIDKLKQEEINRWQMIEKTILQSQQSGKPLDEKQMQYILQQVQQNKHNLLQSSQNKQKSISDFSQDGQKQSGKYNQERFQTSSQKIQQENQGGQNSDRSLQKDKSQKSLNNLNNNSSLLLEKSKKKNLEEANLENSFNKKRKQNLIEFQSSPTNSQMSQNSFRIAQQTTFEQILKNEGEMNTALALRIKAIDMRYKSQIEQIDNLVSQNTLTPKSANKKKIELQQWIEIEKLEIMKTQRMMEKSWKKAKEALNKNQRDFNFTQQLRNGNNESVNNDKNFQQYQQLKYEEEKQVGARSSNNFSEINDSMGSEDQKQYQQMILKNQRPSDSSPFNILHQSQKSLNFTKSSQKLKDQEENFKNMYEQMHTNQSEIFTEKDLQNQNLKLVLDEKDLTYDHQKEQNQNGQEINLKINNNIKNQKKQSKRYSLNEGEGHITQSQNSSIQEIGNQSDKKSRNQDNNYIQNHINVENEAQQYIEEEEQHQDEQFYKQQNQKQKSQQQLNSLDSDNNLSIISSKITKEVQNIKNKDQNQDQEQLESMQDIQNEISQDELQKLKQLQLEQIEKLELQQKLEEQNQIQKESLEQDQNQVQIQNQNDSLNVNNEVVKSQSNVSMVNDLIAQFQAEINEKWKMNMQVETRLVEQLKKESAIDQSDNYGIATNIYTVTNYLQKLYKYIKENENHLNEFIQNVNTPFGFAPAKRLKLIHGYDSFVDSNLSDTSEDEYNTLPFVLSEDLFIEFEQNIIGNGDDEKQQIIKEFEHIHNKAIFDTFNESLNLYRPYFNLGGPPYAWSNSEKNIVNEPISKQNFEKFFIKAQNKILEWGGYLCGLINEQEEPRQKQQDEEMTLAEVMENLGTQNECFNQVREERLSRMLLTDIYENEYKWQLYEDEKAEVVMELADLVFEELVENVVEQLYKF